MRPRAPGWRPFAIPMLLVGLTGASMVVAGLPSIGIPVLAGAVILASARSILELLAIIRIEPIHT